MSYFVTAVVQLRAATPGQTASLDVVMVTAGLGKVIKGASGVMSALPTNTFAGEFKGESTSKVRDDLCTSIQDAMSKAGLHATLFLVVGDGWAWGTRHT